MQMPPNMQSATVLVAGETQGRGMQEMHDALGRLGFTSGPVVYGWSIAQNIGPQERVYHHPSLPVTIKFHSNPFSTLQILTPGLDSRIMHHRRYAGLARDVPDMAGYREDVAAIVVGIDPENLSVGPAAQCMMDAMVQATFHGNKPWVLSACDNSRIGAALVTEVARASRTPLESAALLLGERYGVIPSYDRAEAFTAFTHKIMHQFARPRRAVKPANEGPTF